MKRGDAGFTLVEVMLVMTVIGIVASVAAPSLVRARAAAVEVSIIGSLRSIHSAQSVYHSTCASGFFAPSIPWLAKQPTAGGVPFISAPFRTDTTDRYGYRIRFSSGPIASGAPITCNGLGKGKGTSTYFMGADLLAANGASVSRYFGVNQSGVIYQSTKRIAPFYTGKPPAPARPVQ